MTGPAGDSAPPPGTGPSVDALDAMTRDELLAVAGDLGLSGLSGAVKADVRAAIDAALGRS